MTQWAGETQAPESIPYRTAVITQEVEPFTRDELFAALVRPQRWVDLLLTDRERWTRTVTMDRHAGLLVAIMLATSLLYALPFGLVLGFDRFWHIAALYLGSVAICLPSLHIFAGYLGLGLRAGQTLSLGVLVCSVASIFSVGFAPIVLFLGATMSGSAMTGVACMLLAVSLFAGMGQLMRSLRIRAAQEHASSLLLLMMVWQCLLLFITFRMGVFLGLGG
ncbi:MAG: hypothetical protein ACI9KE_005192 [Polyangiales bacterium]|jgi:hypothetical protein